MTQTKTWTNTLTCRIREHVITRDGDLIPAGTPCKVLGWSHEEGKIEVRAAAYVYADEWECLEESGTGRDLPATGRGLCLAVHPGNLTFDSIVPDRR